MAATFVTLRQRSRGSFERLGELDRTQAIQSLDYVGPHAFVAQETRFTGLHGDMW